MFRLYKKSGGNEQFVSSAFLCIAHGLTGEAIYPDSF
jgi:hypothetical protein